MCALMHNFQTPPPFSVSFILEACVFADLVVASLGIFVVAATWHMGKHFLVAVREGRRVLRLLRCALDLSPLSRGDAFWHVVRARAGCVHFRDDPGLSTLG